MTDAKRRTDASRRGASNQASTQRPAESQTETPSARSTETSPAKPEAPGRDEINSTSYRERVYRIIRQIPAGRVMTYGQIADLLGEGYTARTVGFVMHAADEHDPWHRVINSQGACSTGRVLLPHNKQQRLLEAEGIEFDARNRCDLGRYRWSPDGTAEQSATGVDRDPQPSLFAD